MKLTSFLQSNETTWRKKVITIDTADAPSRRIEHTLWWDRGPNEIVLKSERWTLKRKVWDGPHQYRLEVFKTTRELLTCLDALGIE